MHRVELKGAREKSFSTWSFWFLMHRVELKETTPKPPQSLPQKTFLMHRVELKDCRKNILIDLIGSVPNVPCGVESQAGASQKAGQGAVPNVPCGVESV